MKIVLSGPPFSAKFIFQSEFFEWFCRVHFVVYNETFFCFGWRNGTGVARQVSISIHHIFSYEAIWWTSEKPLFRNQINVATQNLIVNKELEIFIRLLKRRNAAANQQQKQKSAHTHIHGNVQNHSWNDSKNSICCVVCEAKRMVRSQAKSNGSQSKCIWCLAIAIGAVAVAVSWK